MRLHALVADLLSRAAEKLGGVDAQELGEEKARAEDEVNRITTQLQQLDRSAEDSHLEEQNLRMKLEIARLSAAHFISASFLASVPVFVHFF